MALKQYKPNTAGQRGLVLTEKSDLYKGKPFPRRRMVQEKEYSMR